MRTVKPSAEVLWVTPDALQMIEAAGRTCYKSEDGITKDSAEKFVKMLLDRGHEAMIEHASASMRLVCDRGVSHEIVRHRLFSYAQESTRYCNYATAKHGGGVAVIEPPQIEGEAICERWVFLCEQAEELYMLMIASGYSPQIARSVLPNALKTEIVVTGNFREWRHFFKLRLSPAAHPQMRELAAMARARLAERGLGVLFSSEALGL